MTGSTIHKLDYDVRCSLAAITRKDGTEWVTPDAPLEKPVLHQAGRPITPIEILLAWAGANGFAKFADIVRTEAEADPTRRFTKTIEVLGDGLGDDTRTAEAWPRVARSMRMLFEIEVSPGEKIHSPSAGRA